MQNTKEKGTLLPAKNDFSFFFSNWFEVKQILIRKLNSVKYLRDWKISNLFSWSAHSLGGCLTLCLKVQLCHLAESSSF